MGKHPAGSMAGARRRQKIVAFVGLATLVAAAVLGAAAPYVS
jgi:hypothetical protein